MFLFPISFPDLLQIQYLYFSLSFLNVVFIYWVGIWGLRQSVVEMSIDPEKKWVKEPSKSDSPDFFTARQDHAVPYDKKNDQLEGFTTKKESLTNAESLTKDEKTFNRLCDFVHQSKIYRQPDLALPSLAQELGISRRKLSKLINHFGQINFNFFINEYRVKEAMALLVDSDYEYLNMVGIASEVGFSSKASFFAVFKKIAGVSPGEYKKQAHKKV